MNEWLDMTTQELANRNGAELLALQLQASERGRQEDLLRFQAERNGLVRELSEAQQVGLRVMRLAREGRKTARLADLLGGP